MALKQSAMPNDYSLRRQGKGSRLITTPAETNMTAAELEKLIASTMRDGNDQPSNQNIGELMANITALGTAPAAADTIISVIEVEVDGVDPLEIDIAADDLLLVMTVQRLSGADNFITVTSSLSSEVLLDQAALDSRPSNDFLLWPANYSRAVATTLTLDISSNCRVVYWVLSSPEA